MTRETRLSPRRAWKALSRLPLSPRRTQVRLKPLLFLRPHPPKGGKPNARRLASAPIVSTRSLMLAYARPGFQPGFVFVPRRGSKRKSTVCGLNGLRPACGGSPPFKSSTRLASSRLLALLPFCAASTGQLRFRFGKKNCNANQFFSPNRNPKDSWRETPNGSAETATAITSNTTQLTNYAYYYEHQSHHHHR